MARIELAQGPIHYEEVGEGPPLVFIHGLAMDGRLWAGAAAELSDRHRCLMPTLPLGSHVEPMSPDADLSLVGQCRLIADFVAALDLGAPATLCFNDWSGAQVMVGEGMDDDIAGLVLVSCETADNYPPGLAGRAAALSAKLPGGLSVMRATIANRWLRRLPMVYGQMSVRGVPDDLLAEWLEPLRRPEIRRDVRKYVGDVRNGRRRMVAAGPALARFARPVLVVWDAEGAMMPNEEGRALARAFPRSRYVELDDCFTLIPIDRPAALAGLIAEFVAGSGDERAGGVGHAG